MNESGNSSSDTEQTIFRGVVWAGLLLGVVGTVKSIYDGYFVFTPVYAIPLAYFIYMYVTRISQYRSLYTDTEQEVNR